VKFSFDAAPGSLMVTGYDQDSIVVRGRALSPPLLLTPETLHEDLEIPALSAIALPLLQSIAQRGTEIILIGTGPRQVFLPSTLVREAAGIGIGVEAMNTPAACRSYNVLVSEHRAVALLLPAK